MTEHRVQIVSAKRIDEYGNILGIGRWFIEHNGSRIGEFANPEADAARHLLDNGLASPGDTLSAYRGDMRSMTGNVGRLAGVAATPRPVSEKKLAGLTAARAALASRRSAARARAASVKTYRDAQVGVGEGRIAR